MHRAHIGWPQGFHDVNGSGKASVMARAMMQEDEGQTNDSEKNADTYID